MFQRQGDMFRRQSLLFKEALHENDKRLMRMRSLSKIGTQELSDKEDIQPQSEIKTLFGYQNRYIQGLGSRHTFVAMYLIVVIVHSLISDGITLLTDHVMKKAYFMSEKTSSWVRVVYQCGTLFILIPISFYGFRLYPPRSLGYGCLFMAIGCLLFITPILYRSKDVVTPSIENISRSACFHQSTMQEDCSIKFKFHYMLSFAGMFVVGMGSAPLHTTALVHLENIYSNKMSSFYMSVAFSLEAISNSLGLIVHRLLNPKTNPNILLCYLFLIPTVIYSIIGILFILFPAPLNKPNKQISIVNETVKEKISNIVAMCTDVTYTCINISVILTAMYMSGLLHYLPILMEGNFGMERDKTGTITFAIYMVSVSLGLILSGIVMKYLFMRLSGILLLSALSIAFSIPPSFSNMFNCGISKVAGVNLGYFNKTIKTSILNHPCNEMCNCSLNSHNVIQICDKLTNIEYISPCFAGCIMPNIQSSDIEFSNCTCIQFNNETSISEPRVKAGKCKRELCSYIYLFIMGNGSFIFFSFLRVVPLTVSTLRIFEQEYKVMAIGFQYFVVIVLGKLWGMQIMSYLFDSTCLLWRKECAKEMCNNYNIQSLSVLCTFTLTTMNIICGSFMLVALVVVSRTEGNEKLLNEDFFTTSQIRKIRYFKSHGTTEYLQSRLSMEESEKDARHRNYYDVNLLSRLSDTTLDSFTSLRFLTSLRSSSSESLRTVESSFFKKLCCRSKNMKSEAD